MVGGGSTIYSFMFERGWVKGSSVKRQGGEGGVHERVYGTTQKSTNKFNGTHLIFFIINLVHHELNFINLICVKISFKLNEL